MNAAPPVIQFADVGQSFGKNDGSAILALDGVTFDIGRNEFLAVLGPSGCGKSTLLRLIAGLILPTRGRLDVYGVPVTEPRDDIGIVFQRPTLLPWFDVLGNVTFPMRHKYGRVTAQELNRARDLLALVGLAGVIHLGGLLGLGLVFLVSHRFPLPSASRLAPCGRPAAL